MPSSTQTSLSQAATSSFAIVSGWPVARQQLVMALRHVSLGLIKLLRSLLTLRFR